MSPMVIASPSHTAVSRGVARHVARCGPGEIAADLQPADLILVRGTGWLGRLIRAAARLRYRHASERSYTYWSHAALVVTATGYLIEVNAGGVRQYSIEKYRDKEFHRVRLDLTEPGRTAAVDFARSCLGQRYGVMGFLLLGLTVVLGDRFRVPDRGQHGCVALIVRALQRAGLAFDRGAADMMPADLAKRFGVTP